jgi:hypothetical protein
LRVDLDGRPQPLWETRGGRYTWGISSPDGQYLAIRGAASERNAWLIKTMLTPTSIATLAPVLTAFFGDVLESFKPVNQALGRRKMVK